MPLINAPQVVDPPAAPPRPYGLFDVALGPLPFPDVNTGAGGITYVPDTCEDDVFLVAMNCPPITGAKTFSPVEAAVSGSPFTVLTSYICTPIGFNFEEAERRVRLRMDLREQRAVERRLWQGSSGVLGTITGQFRNATNLGSAGCVTEAIEMLEQTLADNAVVGGLIHARVGMTPHLANNHLIVRPNIRYMGTPYGTQYVFGQGYDGTGPTGQAVDTSTEWMYATGRVAVWRDSEVFVPPPRQTLDKSTNQLNLVAERMFMTTIECGVWAVQVTRTCTTSGGGT